MLTMLADLTRDDDHSLRAGVRALVVRLRAHEAAEEELLQETLERDLGGRG